MSKGKVRLGAAAIVGIAALASAPVALVTMAKNGIEVPGGDSAARLLAMLDSRSPGARENGALSLTKVRKPKAQATVPHERALGKIIAPKQPASPIDEAIPNIVPILSTETFGTFGGGASIDMIPFSGSLPELGNAPLPAIIGTPILGGSPPGTPGTPGSPGIAEIPVIPPAVPEPATWMTMLLGFGIIGWTARRRRSVIARRASPGILSST